jgi:hypothetical protein
MSLRFAAKGERSERAAACEALCGQLLAVCRADAGDHALQALIDALLIMIVVKTATPAEAQQVMNGLAEMLTRDVQQVWKETQHYFH